MTSRIEIAAAKLYRIQALQVVRGLTLPKELKKGINTAIEALQMPLYKFASMPADEVKKAFIRKVEAALGGIDDALKERILFKLAKKL